MKKRILSLVLAAIMFVTIFPITALADAAPVRRTSEAGIVMIKGFEGFSPKAVFDSSQWSIGYGVACNPADYPKGIDEAGAEALLRAQIVKFEDSVSGYAAKYGIALSQNQFDALVSITFNLGTAWIDADYRFWRMLREGLGHYTDNQIASAIGVWCHAGGAVNTGLLRRRIAEVRLFLYGDYTPAGGHDFTYLLFHGNGGSIETDVRLYRKGGCYGDFPSAERVGFHFGGWYTAKEGGVCVKPKDLADKNQTLYARWLQTPVVAAAKPAAPGGFSDVPASAWYAPYVTALSQAGIIGGFADGSFRPTGKVTVGEALKLVLLGAGNPRQAPTQAHWASGYAAVARERGILDGLELENLDRPITRALVAKLTANTLGLPPSSEKSAFSDTDDGYANALQRRGIVDGSADASGNRVFCPEDTITRAEISKIVRNMRKSV